MNEQVPDGRTLDERLADNARHDVREHPTTPWDEPKMSEQGDERIEYEGLINIGAHYGECCDLDGLGELGTLLCGAVLDAAERATGKASWGYTVRGRVVVEIPKQPPIDSKYGKESA